MGEQNKDTSVGTPAGNLKLGSAKSIIVSDQECWYVPHLGIYDNKRKYLGETVEEAAAALEKRQMKIDQNKSE